MIDDRFPEASKTGQCSLVLKDCNVKKTLCRCLFITLIFWRSLFIFVSLSVGCPHLFLDSLLFLFDSSYLSVHLSLCVSLPLSFSLSFFLFLSLSFFLSLILSFCFFFLSFFLWLFLAVPARLSLALSLSRSMAEYARSGSSLSTDYGSWQIVSGCGSIHDHGPLQAESPLPFSFQDEGPSGRM